MTEPINKMLKRRDELWAKGAIKMSAPERREALLIEFALVDARKARDEFQRDRLRESRRKRRARLHRPSWERRNE